MTYGASSSAMEPPNIPTAEFSSATAIAGPPRLAEASSLRRRQRRADQEAAREWLQRRFLGSAGWIGNGGNGERQKQSGGRQRRDWRSVPRQRRHGRCRRGRSVDGSLAGGRVELEVIPASSPLSGGRRAAGRWPRAAGDHGHNAIFDGSSGGQAEAGGSGGTGDPVGPGVGYSGAEGAAELVDWPTGGTGGDGRHGGNAPVGDRGWGRRERRRRWSKRLRRLSAEPPERPGILFLITNWHQRQWRSWQTPALLVMAVGAATETPHQPYWRRWGNGGDVSQAGDGGKGGQPFR